MFEFCAYLMVIGGSPEAISFNFSSFFAKFPSPSSLKIGPCYSIRSDKFKIHKESLLEEFELINFPHISNR